MSKHPRSDEKTPTSPRTAKKFKLAADKWATASAALAETAEAEAKKALAEASNAKEEVSEAEKETDAAHAAKKKAVEATDVAIAAYTRAQAVLAHAKQTFATTQSASIAAIAARETTTVAAAKAEARLTAMRSQANKTGVAVYDANEKVTWTKRTAYTAALKAEEEAAAAEKQREPTPKDVKETDNETPKKKTFASFWERHYGRRKGAAKAKATATSRAVNGAAMLTAVEMALSEVTKPKEDDAKEHGAYKEPFQSGELVVVWDSVERKSKCAAIIISRPIPPSTTYRLILVQGLTSPQYWEGSLIESVSPTEWLQYHYWTAPKTTASASTSNV